MSQRTYLKTLVKRAKELEQPVDNMSVETVIRRGCFQAECIIIYYNKALNLLPQDKVFQYIGFDFAMYRNLLKNSKKGENVWLVSYLVKNQLDLYLKDIENNTTNKDNINKGILTFNALMHAIGDEEKLTKCSESRVQNYYILSHPTFYRNEEIAEYNIDSSVELLGRKIAKNSVGIQDFIDLPEIPS